MSNERYGTKTEKEFIIITVKIKMEPAIPAKLLWMSIKMEPAIPAELVLMSIKMEPAIPTECQ